MKGQRPTFRSAASLLSLLGLCVSQPVWTQELEPRRWTHLPIGANFAGLGYALTDGNVFLDPSLLIEGATADVHSVGFGYTRSLNVLGKSGRVDVKVPYSRGRWAGELDGEFASIRRGGFGDPRVRFAVNLIGSPAQTPAEFARYRPGTIVGVALDVAAPLGEYQEGKLINLGTNRWTFRPQVGLVHNRNRWTYELTASAWLFSNNDEYFQGTKLEQDPLYSLQGHLIYTFRPGLWASISMGYGAGARATINGVRAGTDQGNLLWVASFGFPIDRQQGIKLAFLRGSTSRATGVNYDSLIVSYAYMWGEGL